MAKAQINFGELGGGTKCAYWSGSDLASITGTRLACDFTPRIIMAFDSEYYGTNKIAILYNADDVTTGTTKFYQQFNGTPSTPNVDSSQQLANINSSGFDLIYRGNYSAKSYVVAIE